MIEREPFLIRNGLRIFGVFAVAGLITLSLVGVRFLGENAENQNEENRYTTRPPTTVELQASCDFFGGTFLGIPDTPKVGYVGLYETCNLVDSALEGKQCEFFDGTWRQADCNVDVTAALQT